MLGVSSLVQHRHKIAAAAGANPRDVPDIHAITADASFRYCSRLHQQVPRFPHDAIVSIKGAIRTVYDPSSL